MKPKPLVISIVLAAVVLGSVAGIRNRLNHMMAMSGQDSITGLSCLKCHLLPEESIPWTVARTLHDGPSGMVISPDGARLYIALDERNQVAVADVGTRRVLRRIPVAGRPFGLALDPEGKRLFITCRDADRVVTLDCESGEELDRISVGMGPVALTFCSTAAGERLVVANSMSDDISVLTLDPLQELSRPTAGREPFAVSMGSQGALAFVANRMANLTSQHEIPAAEVTVLDPATGRIQRREPLHSAHLSEGVAAVPTRGWTIVPLVKVRNLVPITQVANGWVMSSGLALFDQHLNQRVVLPLDEANAYYPDPSGIAVDPAGRRAFVASGGIDVVSVIDLDHMAEWLQSATGRQRDAAIRDLSLSSSYVTARVPTGHNPGQLVISPDGDTLFVAERLQDSVLVLNTATLEVVGRIALGDGGDDDELRRGERLFRDARYTFQHQFSCRSCHPDGHVDGLSYDFDIDGIGDNLLDNRSLLGVGGTAPFKWNGKNTSLEMQCGPRFAKVLMRTDPFPEDKLRELTAFIRSQPPARVRPAGSGELTEAQVRGRDLFFARHTSDGSEIPYRQQCATCHRPPLYTSRGLSDVGTQSTTDSSSQFDIPHLLGIGGTAPYLHDGRAKTLEEIWTVYSPADEHGVTSYMTKSQLNDLVEYLKTL